MWEYIVNETFNWDKKHKMNDIKNYEMYLLWSIQKY